MHVFWYFHPNFSRLQMALGNVPFLRNYYQKDVNVPWISGQHCLMYYLSYQMSSAEVESFLGHEALTVMLG